MVPYPHPQVQRSVLQKLKRLFSVNGGVGLGVDVTSQMLAFSILRILAGEEELRWYVGTRVSLYAQNNMSSGGGTVTSCGSQWETGSLFPRLTGPAAAVPSGPFCYGVEADGECGQCSCRYSVPKVFIVARSRMVSTENDKCHVHVSSPERYLSLPGCGVFGALILLRSIRSYVLSASQ